MLAHAPIHRRGKPMSNDRNKSDDDGGDLERTEEKSAAELDALVKAAEGSTVEDEITHTGDPDELERAALASVGHDEEQPPSSEGVPVSIRELETEPMSLRDLEREPVSLRDVELAMAPGKAPPKLPAPRAPAASPPAAPGPAAGSPAVPAAPKARVIPRAPLKARQPSQPDAEEAGAVPPIRKRVSSIPPPLPKPGSDDELMRLSGGLSAPLLPNDLAIPGMSDLVVKTGERSGGSPDADKAIRARPAPPRKRRPAAEASVEAAGGSKEAGGDTAPETGDAGPRSERTSKGPKSKRTSKSPPSEATGATAPGDATTPSKGPPRSERPRVAPSKRPPANAQTNPPDEPPRSRATTYLAVAAALAVAGYFALGRGETPPPPPQADASKVEPAQAAAGPEAPPSAEAVSAPPATDVAVAADSATPAPTAIESAPAAVPTTAKAPRTNGNLTSEPPTPPTSGAPSTTTKPTPPASAAPAVASGPFDRSAASAAMSSAVGSASGCKKEGDPSGVAHVTVTFAPSGRVTQANIGGPPFAGTATGGCIARAFKTARIPPFEGDPVTVSKTVNLP